jgi:hypothetical protein
MAEMIITALDRWFANLPPDLSPLVIKYDGKLTDVYGEIRITLFSEELNFILNNGGEIIKIHQGYIYERSTT